MAKRRPKYKQQNEALEQRKALFRKLGWALIITVSLLFGISVGYPIAIEGDIAQGILTGLGYGGGALFILLVSVFLNQKLKGY